MIIKHISSKIFNYSNIGNIMSDSFRIRLQLQHNTFNLITDIVLYQNVHRDAGHSTLKCQKKESSHPKKRNLLNI